MAKIYLPGSHQAREWIVCKRCGKEALVCEGGKGFCSRSCALKNTSSGTWKGDDASYGSFHDRVRNYRGRPTSCVWGCQSDAYDWASLTGDHKNIDDYAAMCRRCHRRYDFARASMEQGFAGFAPQRAKLTLDQVRELRRRRGDGEKLKDLAAEYGVRTSTLSQIVNGKRWAWA